ncbi:hypothetical protein [Saccharicrinis aurantiacus]|uniref:hypothetical protein n=1 Tax=Saccharicrinis aurantiacus TaxID=1849719 RepID=UPI000838327B|nr:hypothetical protein [Saccharicrinis aurantiacus]
MKKILLYSALAAAFSFTACDDSFTEHEFLPAADVAPSLSEVTLFDTPFTVDFAVSNPAVESIKVTGGEGVDQTIAVSSQSASLALKDSDFGAYWAIDSMVYFNTEIDYGSNKSTGSFSVSVIAPTSAEAGGSVSEYSSDKNYITLACNTVATDLTDVKAEKRRVVGGDFENTDWVEVTGKLAGTSFEFVDSIMGTGYDLTDTIQYRVVANSGAYSDMAMVTIPVISKYFASMDMGYVMTDMDFAFMPVEVEEGEDSKDAGVLTLTSSASAVGFTSVDTKFVKVELGTAYPEGHENEGELDPTTGDVLSYDELASFSKVVEIFDGGSQVMAVDAMVGDVYVFSYEYSEENDKGEVIATHIYYGYFTISTADAALNGNAAKVGFSFSQDIKEVAAM